jgi:hypothetical protein
LALPWPFIGVALSAIAPVLSVRDFLFRGVQLIDQTLEEGLSRVSRFVLTFGKSVTTSMGFEKGQQTHEVMQRPLHAFKKRIKKG